MYANPLFPEIVSSYKERYKLGIRESFSSYCQSRHVAYRSVMQWMSRHGMDVTSIRLEALLEQGGLAANGCLSLQSLEQFLSGKEPLEAPIKDKKPACESLLQSITITFPDGVIISVRRATAEALEKLISKYQPTTSSICLP